MEKPIEKPIVDPKNKNVTLYVNQEKSVVIRAELKGTNNIPTPLASDSSEVQTALENINADNYQSKRKILLNSTNQIEIAGNFLQPNQFNPDSSSAIESGVNNLLSSFGVSGEQITGASYKPIFSETLQYPLDLSKEQDRMLIRMYRYKTTGLLATSNSNRSANEILGTIILPMPSQLPDVSEVKWGTQSLSNAQIAQGILGFVSNFRSGGSTNEQKANTATNTRQQSAKFEGIPVDETLTRFSGVITNPNQDLLFSGVGLRQFTYTYVLIPRNAKESLEIRKIVRTFRQGMLPRKLNGGVIVGAPNTFRIKFVKGGTSDTPLKDVRRHKEMALSNFVAYPMLTDSWMTYDDNDHSALGFKVQMTFQELTPVYYNDFEENGGKDINDDPIDGRSGNGNIIDPSVGY